MAFQTVNPADGCVLKTYEYLTDEAVEERIQNSWKCFHDWRLMTVKDRASKIHGWARSLKDLKENLARQMTLEMGKPISQSRLEIDKCIFTCEYIATEGPRFLESKVIESPYSQSWISYEPLGPILAIMPWNFPLWQTVRFAAPALLAGNTVLLKHSDLVRGSAELIEASLAEASNGFQVMQLFSVSHEVAADVISDSRVRGVTFTGSTRGGRQVAEVAGRSLKKHALELGGSDAYLVMADANLERAAQICADARLVNGGQSCVAAKRFIVESAVIEEFLSKFVACMARYRAEDPMEQSCQLGPLASKRFQIQLQEQVDELCRLGGQVLLGGQVPSGPGAFYPATVILFRDSPDRVHEIETFGPVAVVVEVPSEDAAVRMANRSPYGLGAAVFTDDTERGQKIMKDLEVGYVVLNDQVRSDVRLPFGGVKDSGYGRELSLHGIHEFCNIKTYARGAI